LGRQSGGPKDYDGTHYQELHPHVHPL